MFGNNYGYGSNAWNSPYGTAIPAQSASSIMCVIVHTEDEVQRYMVAPNTTVLLICFELKKFWLKGTDQNGVQAPLRVFDFDEKTAPMQQTQNAEMSEIRAELKRLSEAVAAMGVKQNVSEER